MFWSNLRINYWSTQDLLLIICRTTECFIQGLRVMQIWCTSKTLQIGHQNIISILIASSVNNWLFNAHWVLSMLYIKHMFTECANTGEDVSGISIQGKTLWLSDKISCYNINRHDNNWSFCWTFPNCWTLRTTDLSSNNWVNINVAFTTILTRTAFSFIMNFSSDAGYFNECNWVFFSDEVEHFLYPRPDEIIITITQPIITTFGLLFNGLFLYILLCVQEMRTMTFLFLANLAICDMAVLLISLVRSVMSYINSPIEWQWHGFAFNSEIACAAALIGGYLFEYCGTLMIFISTLDRFLAICKPFKYRVFATQKNGIKIVVFCWVISTFFAAFEADYSLKEVVCLQWPEDDAFAGYPTKVDVCGGRTWWAPLVTVSFDLCLFTFVAASCCVFSVSILIKLKKKTSETPQQQGILNIRHQIARMVVTNTLIFLLLLTPFQLFNVDSIAYHTTGRGILPDSLVLILPTIISTLRSLNSAINPVIYSVMCQRVRRALMETLLAWTSHRVTV